MGAGPAASPGGGRACRVRPGLCLVAIGLGAMCVVLLLAVASRAGDRGVGAGRRWDRHRLRSAVGDNARSRRTGRGGPGDLGSSALRCTRSGHRHRGGGGHRGRRGPDRAPPWRRAGVRVRYRGRADRGRLCRAWLPVSTHPVDAGDRRTSGRICGDKNRDVGIMVNNRETDSLAAVLKQR